MDSASAAHRNLLEISSKSPVLLEQNAPTHNMFSMIEWRYTTQYNTIRKNQCQSQKYLTVESKRFADDNYYLQLNEEMFIFH